MANNPERKASLTRNTRETRITVSLDIDGSGKADIQTGIPFFDHMLDLFAHHGLFDLKLKVEGDIDVDYHHTVEDVGILLGEAIKKALGEKRGIYRYGFYLLPMDEALARAALDLSNRPYLVYEAQAEQFYVRDFNIALFKEFFQALANTAGMNLHLQLLHGSEPHHVAEALFKAFARALDAATQIDPRRQDRIPSTKETLS